MNLVTENDNYFKQPSQIVEFVPLGVKSVDKTESVQVVEGKNAFSKNYEYICSMRYKLPKEKRARFSCKINGNTEGRRCMFYSQKDKLCAILPGDHGSCPYHWLTRVPATANWPCDSEGRSL